MMKSPMHFRGKKWERLWKCTAPSIRSTCQKILPTCIGWWAVSLLPSFFSSWLACSSVGDKNFAGSLASRKTRGFHLFFNQVKVYNHRICGFNRRSKYHELSNQNLSTGGGSDITKVGPTKTNFEIRTTSAFDNPTFTIEVNFQPGNTFLSFVLSSFNIIAGGRI